MMLRKGYPRPDCVPDGYVYVSTNRERLRHGAGRRPIPWNWIAVALAGVALVAVAAFCLWRIHVIESRQQRGPAGWVTPSPYGPPPACAGFPSRRCADG